MVMGNPHQIGKLRHWLGSVYSHQNLDPKTAVHFLDSSQHYWPRKIYGQMLEVIVKRVFEAKILIYNVFKSYRGFFLMIYKFSAKKGSLVRCILWLQFLHLGLMLHK